MPRFTYEVSGQFQNIASLSMPDDYPWHVQLMCTSCHERHERPAVISMSDAVDGLGNDSVHLRISCAFCGKKGTVKIVQDKLRYDQDRAPDWAPLLVLECRNVQPVGVVLPDDTPLVVAGESGFQFEDAFIEDGEFFSYDEARNVEASITEFATRVVRT